MGLGQTGHARQGVPEGFDSLIEVALAHQRYAEVVVDLGVNHANAMETIAAFRYDKYSLSGRRHRDTG